ncbi:MAG: hypothetical protein JNG90_14880 [Planctomycetaceae bacterium]|nr:hypothetical protein [Planctomycetaceae bacterium]
MPVRRRFLALAVACLALPVVALGADPQSKSSWEGAIARFEQADREQPPAAGGIVFVGSSSIRLWDLKESFPDLPVLNRGFGGSHLSDSVHFADRIVTKYRPRLVVLYAGDNDIASGKTPERVRDDFRAFVDRVHSTLPETKILFLAIKPSPARAKHAAAQATANRLIADEIAKNPRLAFVDVGTPLLDAAGKPRAELFVKDQLHLSEEGYAVWSELLRPLLQ